MSEGKRKPEKGAVREYTEAIVVALAIALLLRFFVIEAFKIPSGSMIDTLEIGDFIFVNKLSHRTEIPYGLLGVKFPGGGTTLAEWRDVQRGDIVVFRYPQDPSTDYIKRIIGIPGDTIEGKRGDLFVNGEKLPRTLVKTRTFRNASCAEHRGRQYTETLGDREYSIILSDERTAFGSFGPIQVKADHLFAMGDNRDNSSDSRAWGQVPVGNVKGRAMFVWLSMDPCKGFPTNLRLRRFLHFVR
jgi:signal peptidase I